MGEKEAEWQKRVADAEEFVEKTIKRHGKKADAEKVGDKVAV